MSADKIGDFLTIIRNGVRVSLPSVVGQCSKMNVAIAGILKNEGFIKNFEIVPENALSKQLKIVLKYVDGESVIHELTRVSKPSRRIYSKVKNLKPVIGGLGISILTTPAGVVTNRQAKHKDISSGGELICTVW